MATVVDVIRQVAHKHGLDPDWAVAVAYQESKLNPRAIGDGGTSFGLYQLHRGGQLGNHTAEWAYNPYNNAEQALSTMAGVAREHPTWSPGQIAVGSQRPAEEVRPAYITNVNNYVQQIKSGRFRPGTGGDAPDSPPGGGAIPTDPAVLPPGDNLGDRWKRFFSDVFAELLGIKSVPGLSPSPIAPAASATSDAIGKLVHFLSLPNLGMRLFSGFCGLVLIVFGIYFFAGEQDT